MEENVMESDVLSGQEQINVENVSDEVLAKIVADGIEYDMVRDILVKPLAVLKVKKVINKPVDTGELDEEDKPIMEMREEEVEVDSVFRTGVILSLPSGTTYDETLKVGMTVVFPHKYSMDFDLFKDSVLVKPYDIVAKVK